MDLDELHVDGPHHSVHGRLEQDGEIGSRQRSATKLRNCSLPAGTSREIGFHPGACDGVGDDVRHRSHKVHVVAAELPMTRRVRARTP